MSFKAACASASLLKRRLRLQALISLGLAICQEYTMLLVSVFSYTTDRLNTADASAHTNIMKGALLLRI